MGEKERILSTNIFCLWKSSQVCGRMAYAIKMVKLFKLDYFSSPVPVCNWQNLVLKGVKSKGITLKWMKKCWKLYKHVCDEHILGIRCVC